MAGSRPILMVIGSGLPAASAFWRNTSIWRPAARNIDSKRWMVTSVSEASSGSLASARPRQKKGPASIGVLVGAGSRVRKSKSGSSARKICSWQGALLAGTTTGATGFFTALPTSRASCEASQPSSSAARWRLACIPTRMRECG